MQTINKVISNGRTKRFTGDVLEDDEIPLNLGAFSEPTCSTIKIGISLKVKTTSLIPSDAAFSIVDNNRAIDSGGTPLSYPLLVMASGPDSLNNDVSINEREVKLVGGVPSLSLVINSNSPVLTGNLTLTHQIYALEAE